MSFIRKLMRGLGVLWGSLTLVFLLFSLVPDPARELAGQNEREEVVDAIREKYGLDQPPHMRYLQFFQGLFPFSIQEGEATWTGIDLGRSFVSDRDVADAIFQALPPTLLLAVMAMCLALFLGISIGLCLAHAMGSWWDRLILGLASLGMSAPSFVMAILVSWFFGSVCHAWTGLSMTGGLWEVDPFEGPSLAWKNAILPALTLGVRPLSVVLQLTRNSAAEVLSSSYIRTARSKGIGTWRIVLHHTLRNSLNPVVTAASGWFASMLAGAVFVEFVFGWQGLGMLMFRALERSDLPMVMGCVAFVAFTFVLINTFVDQIYQLLDPRVRAS
jgi:peptide/nickel transport system permease protein